MGRSRADPRGSACQRPRPQPGTGLVPAGAGASSPAGPARRRAGPAAGAEAARRSRAGEAAPGRERRRAPWMPAMPSPGAERREGAEIRVARGGVWRYPPGGDARLPAQDGRDLPAGTFRDASLHEAASPSGSCAGSSGLAGVPRWAGGRPGEPIGMAGVARAIDVGGRAAGRCPLLRPQPRRDTWQRTIRQPLASWRMIRVRQAVRVARPVKPKPVVR
jgi:hypothetical protein